MSTSLRSPHGTNTLNRFAARHHDKIDDWYKDCDGIWLNLKAGWRASECDYVHTIHEDRARDVIAAFRWVHPCDCDDCTARLAEAQQ